VSELGASGENRIIELLVNLKDEVESESYAELGGSSQETTFSMWVSFFASLNETAIVLE
jgi:hypothetical protein